MSARPTRAAMNPLAVYLIKALTLTDSGQRGASSGANSKLSIAKEKITRGLLYPDDEYFAKISVATFRRSAMIEIYTRYFFALRPLRDCCTRDLFVRTPRTPVGCIDEHCVLT